MPCVKYILHIQFLIFKYCKNYILNFGTKLPVNRDGGTGGSESVCEKLVARRCSWKMLLGCGDFAGWSVHHCQRLFNGLLCRLKWIDYLLHPRTEVGSKLIIVPGFTVRRWLKYCQLDVPSETIFSLFNSTLYWNVVENDFWGRTAGTGNFGKVWGFSYKWTRRTVTFRWLVFHNLVQSD